MADRAAWGVSRAVALAIVACAGVAAPCLAASPASAAALRYEPPSLESSRAYTLRTMPVTDAWLGYWRPSWVEEAVQRDGEHLEGLARTDGWTMGYDPSTHRYETLAWNIDVQARRWDVKYRRLQQRTKYINVMHMTFVGLLLLAPEDVSKWTEDDKDLRADQLAVKWMHNVRAGPVLDEDEFYLNWIAHPQMGASYYQVARNEGLGRWESFWYAFFVSTVLWEYGIEACAEEPSLQDLVITPVVGSLLGEECLYAKRRIQRRGGRVLGSRLLGSLSLFMMDPFGIITHAIEKNMLRVFGQHAQTEFFHEMRTMPFYFKGEPYRDVLVEARTHRVTGFRLMLRF